MYECMNVLSITTPFDLSLTVDGIAMEISRMAPSHFLWKKPYKCWDTVSQLCRLRLMRSSYICINKHNNKTKMNPICTTVQYKNP